MAEAGDFDGLLDRLTAAGLATHVFAANPAVAEAGSLDDEADLLDALGALADGPLWRVGPFRYALCAGAGAETLLADLAAARPGSPALDGATLVPLTVPDSPAASRAFTLLTVAAEGALALPGAARLVIDTPLAEAAARDAIARIDTAAEAAAARLATPAGIPDALQAQIKAAITVTPAMAQDIAALRAALDTAAPPAADETIAPALARIEAALAAAADSGTLAADIAALRTAVEAPRTDPALAEGLSRIEAALADAARHAGAARQPDPALADLAGALSAQVTGAARLEALAEAIVNRLDSQQAALDALAARAAAPADDDRIDAIARVVAEIAARPQVNVDFHREREGMVRLSSAMQTMLGNLDAAAARFDLGPVLERLDGHAALIGALAETAPTAAPAADDPRVDEIADIVREIAARPQVNVDFHREREGMIRLSSAMQTILGRLDGAASRLIEGAGAGHEAIAALAERLDGLAAALDAPDATETAAVDALRSALDEGLGRLEDALARRDGEARSLVGAAQRIGAACAELHGLHSRYLDAEQAAPALPAPRVVADARAAGPVAPDPHTADPYSTDIDADLARFDDDLDADAAPPSRQRGRA